MYPAWMELKPRHFKVAKGILLDIAQERTLKAVLSKVVEGNAQRPRHAFTGIWLLDRGDLCSSCAMVQECSNRSRCLHLVASANQLRGAVSTLQVLWQRIPLGVGEIGRVASTGRQCILANLRSTQTSVRNPEWIRTEGIRGFNGQPIVYKGEILGVLAMYNRHPIDADGASMWWRMIADHIGAAIVNARAFEEIEHLKSRLETENAYLREEVNESDAFGDLVGESVALKSVKRQIELVAPTDASVLILGESGTGKELVAREIHRRSLRADRPMIRVNCASIPHELYESEFFGHVRGAFTGAVRDRVGRFEAADGGTLFLDEVGEIPAPLQSKLLRVLQEQQFERVGEEKSRQVDVRFIAATNRDLKEDVESGRFRQDLYYRLCVFPIEVAPLRRRADDIPMLTRHLLDRAARKLNCQIPELTSEHILKLQGYRWPGNVRELQNIIERAVISSRSGILTFDLPESPKARRRGPDTKAAVEVVPEPEMRRRERANMVAALEQSNWRIYGANGAAELLQLKPTTLATRIRALGIERRPSPRGEQ